MSRTHVTIDGKRYLKSEIVSRVSPIIENLDKKANLGSIVHFIRSGARKPDTHGYMVTRSSVGGIWYLSLNGSAGNAWAESVKADDHPTYRDLVNGSMGSRHNIVDVALSAAPSFKVTQ